MKDYMCYKRIGDSIKRHRRIQRMSQDDLAFVSHIDRTTLARIEKGRANPTLSILVRVSRGLNVKLHKVIDTA